MGPPVVLPRRTPDKHLRAVGFDRHAAPAAVAALTPAKRGSHGVEIDRQPGGHAVDDRHERLVRATHQR